MTDEQIIKALECCMKGNNFGGCCPYDDEGDICEECTSKLAKDALDLIKRQQMEIEDLIKQRDEQLRINRQVVRMNGKHVDERNRLKSKLEKEVDLNRELFKKMAKDEAEIERLQSLCASKDVIINSQEAEIMQNENRFPHFTEDTQVVTVSKKADGQYYADRVTTIQVDKIRAEAIKEFAEEFEKRCIASGIYPAITKNLLNNLVKELTEEK